MPIPTPSSGESDEDFLNRCMDDSKMVDEFPDEVQRFAVCVAQALVDIVKDELKQIESV